MTVLKVSPDLNMVCNGEEGKGGSEAGTPAPPLVQMIDLFDAAHKEGAAMRHGSPVAGPSGAGSGAQFVVLDVVAQGAGAAAAVPATVGGRGSHKGAGFRGLASMAPPPAGTPASAGVPPAAAPGLAPHRAGRAAMAATVAAIASPARTDAYSSGYVCPTMDDPALSSAASVVLSSAVIDSVTRSMARRAGGGGGGGAAAAGTGGAAVPAP